MTNTIDPELVYTLDDAVKEVLGNLTGQDLTYDPRFDRYQAVTRQLNRALRSNALEHEWSYYHYMWRSAQVIEGQRKVVLPPGLRPRVKGDDAVRVALDDEQETEVLWAYVLPRDALSKYADRPGLWCSITRNEILFNRPLYPGDITCFIRVPVMREPTMFRLPMQPEDPDAELVEVPQVIRDQPIDFAYPDVITVRAAFYYAQTDPIMQPRVQTLEAQYKDLMYQVIERDDNYTDSPYQNEFVLDIQSGLSTPGFVHQHPHATGM